MLTTILFTIITVSLAIGMISLRLIFVKDGEFRGTCASNNPMLKNQVGDCSVCGKKAEEPCQGDELDRVKG
ncbi:MAG: hypothetical protein EA412_02625 [Chitinophagaceae bacterium]|nr:MAG: hypothetical protein EA412_02625 [Chitinophagaceae bacterium]